ncbi:MAG: DNA polymerase III subunit beta [Nitrospira sp.]|nr:MAG: DNA polymerase III subunit beta [Nitrospira sp.]
MARVSQLGAQRKLRRYMDPLRRELPRLRTKFHVQYLGLFGSYVQGTPWRDSDLDVLVEFAEEPSLFEFIELEDHLSSLLGVKVDLVMKGTLKPLIVRHILSEVVGL